VIFTLVKAESKNKNYIKRCKRQKDRETESQTERKNKKRKSSIASDHSH
jgi:hypothetical protein